MSGITDGLIRRLMRVRRDGELVDGELIDEVVNAMVDARTRELADDPCSFILVFTDTDRPAEYFSGAGATGAAYSRFETMRAAWTCHLYLRIASSV